MSADEIVAIVPMKPLRLSKTRLASQLSPEQRAALSQSMFRKVVASAVASSVGSVWVVGGDDVIEKDALELGASWYSDCGSDLNDSLTLSIERAFEHGVTPLYLPADLPLLTSSDVDGLVEASQSGQTLTLSPAHSDGGTNAMLIPQGSIFRPALGMSSFKRHKELAASKSLPMEIFDSIGIGFDLDTPDDLEALRELHPQEYEQLIGRADKNLVCG